jgi:hypothetical protein
LACLRRSRGRQAQAGVSLFTFHVSFFTFYFSIKYNIFEQKAMFICAANFSSKLFFKKEKFDQKK